MGSRIFDRSLSCGCLYSSDKGGGLMPCSYDASDKKQNRKCEEATEKWMKSKDYRKYLKEVRQKNK